MMQGLGAAGVATVAAKPVLAIQDEEDGTAQEDSTAIRVAHASPDAPGVNVFLEPAEGADDEMDGGMDDSPPDEDEEDETGNETSAQEEDDEIGQDAEPAIEELEFRDVSDYSEVDPGSYQVRVEAVEAPDTMEDTSQDEEAPVVFDEELELEEGTTYTAVAFGELAQADIGEGGVGMDDEDTVGDEDQETDEEDGFGDDTTQDEDEENGFGDDTTQDEDEEDGFGEDETGGQMGDDNVLIEQLGFGEYEYVDVEAGDYTLEIREVEPAEDEEDGFGDDTTQDEDEEDGFGDDTTQDEDEENGFGDDTTQDEDEENGFGDDTTQDEEDGLTGQEADSDTAFQIQVLEDELTVSESTTGGTEFDDAETVDDEENGTQADDEDDEFQQEEDEEDGLQEDEDQEESEMSRVRVFHAVPDVDAVDVVAVEEDDDGGLQDDDFEEDEDDETDMQEDDEEDTIGEDDTTQEEDEDQPTTDQDEMDEDGVQEAEISVEGGIVYSGFAVGYFDPEAAGDGQEDGVTDDEQEDGITDDEDEQEDGVTDDEQEDGVTDDEQEDGVTDDEQEDGVTDDEQDAEFELVVVEDAEDGERSNGGTDESMLSVSSPATVTTD